MNIVINGESRTVPAGMTALQMLEELGMTNKRLAVEVNQEIVPRSGLSQRRLQAGDRIEIIQAIGGG